MVVFLDFFLFLSQTQTQSHMQLFCRVYAIAIAIATVMGVLLYQIEAKVCKYLITRARLFIKFIQRIHFTIYALAYILYMVLSSQQ